MLASCALLLLLGDCGGDETSSSTSQPPVDGGGTDAGVACAPGTLALDDGRCEPAGLPSDAACPPGEMPLTEGGCEPAGIPEAGCGEGFVPTGDGSCDPILPEVDCDPGMIALPGGPECQELAPCGDAPWGDIPVEAGTQYVDGAYLGGDSDGTAGKPWLTISDAVQAAPDGGLVAVAEGSYVEDVLLEGKAVRLWGRCPRLVEVVGSAEAYGAIFVREGADGSEIRQLAVRGDNSGIVIGASEQLVIDGVWIHDTARRGLDAENAFGAIELGVSRTLVERASSVAVVLLGLSATLEGVEIRDTLAGDEEPTFGTGLAVQASPYDELRSEVTVVGSLLRGNRDRNVSVVGSTLVMERSVVRGTLARDDGHYGRALEIYPNAASHARSDVTLRSSVLERSLDHGVFAVASELRIEQSVVRTTESSGIHESPGVGIGIYPPSVVPLDMAPTTVTIRSSVVEDHAMAGILVASSVLQLESSLVRDIRPWAETDTLGRGLDVVDWAEGPLRSTAMVRWSVVERAHEVGLSVMGSDVTLDASVVRDTCSQQADQRLGRGINAQPNPLSGERANVTILGSLIERNREVAVAVIGSDATIEQSLIRDTLGRDLDGRAGRAIHTQLELQTGELATLALRGVAIEGNREVAVAIAGTEATIEGSRISSTQPQASDGFGGDALVVQAHGDSTVARIEGSLIETSHRAGVACFGADVQLGGSRLDCNVIQLDGELWQGSRFHFTDLGGNVCGCGDETVTCMLMSTDLEPPAPL